MPDANLKRNQGHQFHHSPLPRPQFGAADRRAAFRASVMLVEGGDCIPNAARTEDVRAEGIIEVHIPRLPRRSERKTDYHHNLTGLPS